MAKPLVCCLGAACPRACYGFSPQQGGVCPKGWELWRCLARQMTLEHCDRVESCSPPQNQVGHVSAQERWAARGLQFVSSLHHERDDCTQSYPSQWHDSVLAGLLVRLRLEVQRAAHWEGVHLPFIVLAPLLPMSGASRTRGAACSHRHAPFTSASTQCVTRHAACRWHPEHCPAALAPGAVWGAAGEGGSRGGGEGQGDQLQELELHEGRVCHRGDTGGARRT